MQHTQEQLEAELKKVIVESLMLEDVTPEEIESEQPLFVEGLGLDSIDALELAIAIDKHWGVRIEAEGEEARRIFANVRSLASCLASQLKNRATARDGTVQQHA